MATPTTQSICIHDNNARLTLELLRRQYPDNEDYWDGNWVVTRFQATAPGFQADFTEGVHLQELVWLREELAKMHATLEGRIEWKAMDGFLELVAEVDRLGHIRWTVKLIYPAGVGARLTLEIANDQTYLPALLNQIDAALEAFPLRGQPNG